jgi:hypothetical protein
MSNSPEAPVPSVSEQMRALAQEFAEACRARGVALDFLPRTLPLVDRLIRTVPVSTTPMATTAYLGEVIARDTGAFWYDFDGRPFLNVGDYQADPLTTVTALFERGQAQEGDVIIDSTKAYCEMICRMQRVWLDGTLLATYESMSALRTSMTQDARLAGWLVGQSQLAVKAAKMQWQESLDFTADSLDAVERILAAIHSRSQKDPLDGPALDEASKTWGAYLGEVIRRRYGGQWSTSADGILQVDLSGTSPQPIAKVRKRIVDGASDNIRVYFFAIPKAMRS